MPFASDRERRKSIVFIVDDDASVREALSSLMRAIGWQVQTFSTAAEFLAHTRPNVPACLVLDVRLPVTSGLELQRILAERSDALPIVFMTGHGEVPVSVKAMKAGAVEFLLKPFSDAELLNAIELALERDAAGIRERTELADIRERMASLSAREHEVMMLVLKGLLNKQAAAELGIAEDTVKVHRHNLMKKMGVRSLPELVRMVERA
ncbi:response regulator transcription factor [Variovorax sp. RA8]|uniref:response regulator transcription factor n=1 Tax=Variovorax sp. (strain JCM 16519 / RA8) TaxID=662548 RepID=UPI000AA89F7B|nr:response regulator [Variovorax sp. RA8]VTU16481.1 Transcriptional regulatory protein FixJ [Variovorax sp. RA8]